MPDKVAAVMTDGWWPSAQALPSPNVNQRPATSEIELLVLHNISLPPGEFGGGFIQRFFLNQLDCDADPYFAALRNLKVCAHILIERDGRAWQFASFERRAWHAGVSQFEGRSQCNDFSIGIELEGTDHIPYTARQYQTLVELSGAIMNTYPKITTQRIVGHSDIAPGRKTDPGPSFDWRHFFALLTPQTNGDT